MVLTHKLIMSVVQHALQHCKTGTISRKNSLPPQIELIVLDMWGHNPLKINMISFKRNAQVWQNHHSEYKRTLLLQNGFRAGILNFFFQSAK